MAWGAIKGDFELKLQRYVDFLHRFGCRHVGKVHVVSRMRDCELILLAMNVLWGSGSVLCWVKLWSLTFVRGPDCEMVDLD